jgi:O-antigen/teichoic acid export membrane protein
MQEIFNDAEPLKNRLLRNGFRMYLLSFIIAPAWYLIKLMVSRSLSVEDVWLVYSIIGFIWLLSAFNDLWLTEALQYYLPHYIIDNEYGKAKTILIVTWIIQFIGWAIIWWWLYFAAPRMAEHYFHSVQATGILRLFCLYFLFINLLQVLQSAFFALQQVKLQYITESIRMRSVVWIVGYLMISNSINTYNFSLSWVIWSLLWLLFSGFLFRNYTKSRLKKSIFVLNKDVLKTQRSYARKIMVGMQVGMIFSNIGQQFAISFLWPYDAGIRTNYMTFFTWVNLLTSPIIWYLFPLFTELYKKWEYQKIQIMKRYINYGLIFLAIAIALGGWFLSEYIAILFFTEKFRISWVMFQWTSLFMFFVIATQVQSNLLAGAWYVKQRVQIMIIWTIISLICSIIWVKTLGLWWLALSNVLTHIYFWWHSLFYLKKFKL